eukprot:18663-Eustigmatos_ZCMA.PRE.1
MSSHQFNVHDGIIANLNLLVYLKWAANTCYSKPSSWQVSSVSSEARSLLRRFDDGDDARLALRGGRNAIRKHRVYTPRSPE